MTVDEIQDVVGRFAQCAAALKAAGFTGVQVHGAHGYLMSQFLSPRSNQREDDYGGSLENRARILLDTVREVRAAVGADFPVAVKLNSADFQKGGFDFEDSLQVSQWLEQAGVDLLEISGGTYEQPKLLGVTGMEEEEPQSVAQSTAQREAYFVDFARAMQDKVTVPLMVTGGFRLRDVMERVVEEGSADLIGLGRPMCVMTDAPERLFAGLDELPRYEASLALMPDWLGFLQRIKSIRAMSSFAVQYWYYAQLDKLGREGVPDESMSVAAATRLVMAQQKAWSQSRG
jgi:2,4-dienoyl-CoA reductase-like NADH-dependent reductase (Old Yellow Enzyme family)